MMKTIRIAAALVLAFFLTARGVNAQKAGERGEYTVTTRLDWLNLELLVEVTLDFRVVGLRMPSARNEGEQMVERDLAGLVREPIFGILVDSYRTVGATTADGTLGIGDLFGILEGKHRSGSRVSADMSSLVVSYEFPITSLSSLYVRHSVPYESPPPLRFVPTKAYSGIIIYAKGILPVRGEYTTDRLKPCLFPRIFDEKMNLVLERNTVDPLAIKAWGLVGYIDAISVGELEKRVGDDPLRIMAYQLFGTNRTDIVITEDDALKIIDLPENRALIKSGRVVIVFDPGT